ncbi:MAG: hypothetical protein AABW79_04765 [Nanoarchaeota archaeon]
MDSADFSPTGSSKYDRLSNLGVTRKYEPKTFSVSYNIDTSTFPAFTDPKSSIYRVQRTIEAILDDSKKNASSATCSFELNGEGKEEFLMSFRTIYDEANIRKIRANDINNFEGTCGLLAGLGSGVAAYIYTCSPAVSAGNYLERASHYLAPIAGLVEAGIPILSAMAGGVIGGFVGLILMKIPSTMRTLSKEKYTLIDQINNTLRCGQEIKEGD